MTGFALLDVAIGILFTLLTFSLIASALQEALASVLNWRGRMLRRGLFRLLEGAEETEGETANATALVNATWLTPELVKNAKNTLAFLQDPAIRALYGPTSVVGQIWDWIAPQLFARARTGPAEIVAGLGRMPSSIPKDVFARTVLNQLSSTVKVGFDDIKDDPAFAGNDVDAALAAGRKLATDLVSKADAAIAAAEAKLTALPMDPHQRRRVLRALREISVQDELRKRLDRLDGLVDQARTALEGRIARADAAITEGIDDLADWFDTTMDRVSGWYVRRAKYVLFALGVVMAAGVNFDLIGYGGQLINSESLRNQIVARANIAVTAGAVGGLKIDESTPLRLLALSLDKAPPGGVPDRKIEMSELEARLSAFTDEQRALLNLPAEGEPTPEQKAAALIVLDAAAKDLVNFDKNGDGAIDEKEARAAVDQTIDGIIEKINLSAETVEDQLGGASVTMGWQCAGIWACISDPEHWFPSPFFSWLLIGLGCTLGGQFWFDLLRSVLKVRTAASGPDTDLKRGASADGRSVPAGTVSTG